MQSKNSSKNSVKSVILLFNCPFRKRLAAKITEFIYQNGGEIFYHDQYLDTPRRHYFCRVEWDLKGFLIPTEKLGASIDNLFGSEYEVEWELFFSYKPPVMGIMVSKYSHCLYDLLARREAGHWNVDISVIISNHPDLEHVAKRFDIDFHWIPVTKENKREQENNQLKILKKCGVDLIVMARYMQILTDEFISHYPNKIINIHHAFLPSFPGSKPYHAAHARGVKLIGATSHYATANLDEGPIIEQDVTRVNHKQKVEDFVRIGRDLETIVLSRAVELHINRKIFVKHGRTVIFH